MIGSQHGGPVQSTLTDNTVINCDYMCIVIGSIIAKFVSPCFSSVYILALVRTPSCVSRTIITVINTDAFLPNRLLYQSYPHKTIREINVSNITNVSDITVLFHHYISQHLTLLKSHSTSQ